MKSNCNYKKTVWMGEKGIRKCDEALENLQIEETLFVSANNWIELTITHKMIKKFKS